MGKISLIIDAIMGNSYLFITAAFAEMSLVEFENIKEILGKQLLICKNGKFCCAYKLDVGRSCNLHTIHTSIKYALSVYIVKYCFQYCNV